MADSSKYKCLLCNEINPRGTKRVNSESSGSHLLYGGNKSNGKVKEDLASQLSVFFLLRKVLDIPQDILGSLLTEFGNPTLWKLQLCRPCSRHLKEAEYLWDKIKTLQRDFDLVLDELKDEMVSSITPDEEKKLKSQTKNLETETVNISDRLRSTFFTNAMAKKGSRKKSTSKDLDDSSGANEKYLKWSEKGIPYFSFDEFQNKLTDIITSAINKLNVEMEIQEPSGQNEVSTKAPSVLTRKESSDVEIIELEDHNENEDEMEIEMDDVQFSTNATITTSNLSTVVLSSSNKVTELPNRFPEVAKSSIRILSTSTLKEPEDNAEDDNESTPHVIGFLKPDPDRTTETDRFTSLGDPLACDEDPLDNDDPDYVPPGSDKEKSSVLSRSSDLDKTLPENIPSKLKSLDLYPFRKGPNVFKCPRCNFAFENRMGCQTHILRDHFDDRQPFHCHICSVKFSLLHPLKDHVRAFHSGVRTPYDDDFDRSTDFISLGASKRQAEEQLQASATALMYKCPACPLRFTFKKQVLVHVKAVHGSYVRQPRRISSSDVSNDAASDTSPVASFSCVKCEKVKKSFKAPSKDVLDAHMKKHHSPINRAPNILRKSVSEPNPKAMKCPDCEKMLPSATAMAEHLKNPENKCSECTKHFLFEMDLKRHMEMQHRNINTLQCPFCPKSFQSQFIYEKHIENHQIHDVHECEVCHIKFTGYANLSRHLETHADYLQQQAMMQQQPQPDTHNFTIET